MWVFLITELMLFGGLFMAFTVYRMYYPQAFDAGSADMDIVLGSINTAVLICSSLTMAFAVHSAQEGNQKLLGLFLLATIIIGALFLASSSRSIITTTWIIRRRECGLRRRDQTRDTCSCSSFSISS